MQHRRALTLVELLVVLFAIALITVVLLPGTGHRRPARIMVSQSNMKQLAIGNANFAAMHDDAIAGYGLVPENIQSSGVEPRDTIHAARIEQAEILRRATGRFEGEHEIRIDETHIPHSRYLHIPILDAMTGQQPEPVAVSPLDVHHLDFQDNPLDCDLLPGGDPSISFGDWSKQQVVNRWPYASSYQTTVYAWSPDTPDETGRLAVTPGPDASTLRVSNPARLGSRKMTEIAFPSMKAFYFEEFDYTKGPGSTAAYYADPDARINVMFFDSSVRRIPTHEANPGWDASNPCDIEAEALIRYRPIDTRYFPEYTGGDVFATPYKWTRGGMRGIDAVGNEIDTSAWCEE